MNLRSVTIGVVYVVALSTAFGQTPPPVLGATKIADAAVVPTGTAIGFTLTTTNSSAAGTGTAFNVRLFDVLPTGPGLVWSISPAYTGPGTCVILAGGTDLSCAFGDLTPGSTATVHVQSPTTAPPGSSAGTYSNIDRVTADNDTTGINSNIARITVNPPPPPSLGATKTADAAVVPTGTTIGFTLTTTNSSAAGTGTAFNVRLFDVLPTGPGLVWSISPAYTGPGTCVILAGGTDLSCAFGDLTPGSTATVHVQSPTTAPPGSSAGTYSNIDRVTADNDTTGINSNIARITVNPPPPPSLGATKTADAAVVPTGTAIGFTLTTTNSSAAGTGTAFNVRLFDVLPTGPGLVWSISPAYTGPGTCVILTGGTDLSCAFGDLTPGSTATVHVQSPTTAPPGSSAGTYSNIDRVTADNDTTGINSNIARITVNPPPPAVTKSFGAAIIVLNGSTSLSFAVVNPNAFPLTSISFTDTLPAGLIVSTPNGLSSNCTGSISATAGSNLISISAGTLPASGSCSFSVNVKGIASGPQNNTTGPVSSDQSGAGATSNTASVTVDFPPTISKMFGATTVPLNVSTSLSFSIGNPNTVPISGVGFTDNLPAGLIVATPNGLTGSCGGGSISAVAGSSTVSLTGATLPASSSCTFAVNVVGVADGLKMNTTSVVTSTEGGNGLTASANLRVAAPPTISKAFADSQIQLFGPGNSTALSFTLANPNTNTTLTGLAFTDTLPSGLILSTPNGLAGSCGGGTITAVAGSNGVGVSGATLVPGASCTFSVNVTGIAIGVQNNTTSMVTSNEALPGNPAVASIAVVDLFFIWFFSGDSGSGHP